jgi:hypothetical protein
VFGYDHHVFARAKYSGSSSLQTQKVEDAAPTTCACNRHQPVADYQYKRSTILATNGRSRLQSVKVSA